MESINLAVLSGLIKEDASTRIEKGRTFSDFTVITYYSVGRGNDKELHPEYHRVSLANPGTISRYLKRGKAVNVVGRVIPDGGVMANSVNFPESKRNE
jgi:hypothetical protein